MKKKLVVLSIVGLMSIGSITYAADKVVTPNIEQSNICLEEARTFNRKNDYTNAEKKLNEAIKLNNKNADAYYELGDIEIRKNNNDKAISYYNKAIRISPDNEEFYFGRATAEAFKFQIKAAIDDLNKVIEINPKNGEAYAVMATIYKRFGYPEKALDCMNKTLQYKETSLDREYQERADIKLLLRDYDGAIADYNQAIIEAKKGTDSLKAQKIEFIKQKIIATQEVKKAFK